MGLSVLRLQLGKNTPHDIIITSPSPPPPTSEGAVLPVGVPHSLQLAVALHQRLLLRLQARLHVQVLLSKAAVGRQRHLPLQLDVLDLVQKGVAWREVSSHESKY